MKQKKYILLVIILLLAFAGIIYTASDFITPYVSISEAKLLNTKVQLKGKISSKDSIAKIDGKSHIIIKDDNDDEITVVYSKTLPPNITHSSEIIAIGKFDNRKNIFTAEEILYKCPSKYEKKAGSNEIKQK